MNYSKEVEIIGQKVLAETSIPEEEKFGSVIALLMVISLCLTAVRIIQECNKINSDPEDIYNDIKKLCNKRPIAKMRIRRAMKKVMSREQYKKYGSELESAIMSVGSHISLSETVALLEVKND